MVGLVWSNDPEGYSGGTVATGRASHDGQVTSDDPDKKEYPGPPDWEVRSEANYPTHVKDLVVEKPTDGRRMDNNGRRPGKIYKDYDLCIAVWNVLCKEQECSKMAIECGGQRRMGVSN